MRFERNQDPKEQMNIGIRQEMLNIVQKEFSVLRVNELTSNDLLKIFCFTGPLIYVTYLVEKEKADIHIDDEHCIRWASEGGHLDIVKYLIKKGANPNTHNKLPLRWAKENGHTDVYEFLKKLAK